MFETLITWLKNQQVESAETVATISMLALIGLTICIIYILLHLILFRWLNNIFRNSHNLFLNTLTEKRLFSNIGYTIQCVLLALQLRIWLPPSGWQETLITISNIGGLLFALLTLFTFLDIIERFLIKSNLAQNFPTRGLIQTVKLIASIFIAILLISMIIGKSPLILLSGLGAMTAVLMLVFKDPILGLVAGIQLSANKMLNVGDWLEMPKYNADGDVIDIGLTTVKVRNWDNTVTTIPTYALISDSFKNWRAMSESGGRRIKRAIFVDSSSIKFLSSQDIEYLKQSKLLTDYLQERQEEIRTFNKQHHITDNTPLNGRHLTNVGTFRAYIKRYLENSPHIHKGMTIMVRQLAPDEKGIPLEIYCFTNTVNWVAYEDIQSDIFDHIFAVAPQFGLHIYQSPSGYDLKSTINSLTNK